MESRLAIFGIVLFAVGILLLAYLLRRVFKRIRYQDTGDPRLKPPRGVNVLLVILALICIVLSQGFFWISSQLKPFRPLDEQGDLGRLTVRQTTDPIRSLEVHYVPASKDSVNVESMFYLSGDSWRVSGEIIRFKLGRGILDLPAGCYKAVEFDGRFLSQRSPSSTGELLHSWESEGGRSRLFELIRDTRYLKWFAEVDSFASEFVTMEGTWNYDLNLVPGGFVKVRYWR